MFKENGNVHEKVMASLYLSQFLQQMYFKYSQLTQSSPKSNLMNRDLLR